MVSLAFPVGEFYGIWRQIFSGTICIEGETIILGGATGVR